MDYKRTAPHSVFITGATGGFGVAMAHRFATAGAALLLHGRDQAKLGELISTLRDQYPNLKAETLCADLTDKKSLVPALQNSVLKKSSIDLLVNNAGGALGLEPFQEADPQDLETMIDLNVSSLVQITRAVLPGMITRKAGHIINIGSISGSWPYPGGHVYCATKAFVRQFSLALRADLAGTSIRVSNIEPGMAETPFSLNRFKGDREKAAAVYAHTTPLTAEDIAESVYWTASLPAHVNINTLELMPTAQSFSALSVERENNA
jgi:NADP-dependent 3-hydroxy acid dehydrogenase YdfG